PLHSSHEEAFLARHPLGRQLLPGSRCATADPISPSIRPHDPVCARSRLCNDAGAYTAAPSATSFATSPFFLRPVFASSTFSVESPRSMVTLSCSPYCCQC